MERVALSCHGRRRGRSDPQFPTSPLAVPRSCLRVIGPVVDDDRVVSVDLMTDAGTAPNNVGLCEQTSTPSSGSPVRRRASRRSVRLSAGRRAGPHARGSTGTSCALLAVARSADISDDEVLRELLELNGGGR